MKILVATGFLVLVLSPVCVSAADSKAGEALFTRSCKTCHGPEGHGNPAIAKALNAAIPDLGSKEVQAMSDADMRKATREGKGKMKPVVSVSDNDIADLIAFIRTLGKK